MQERYQIEFYYDEILIGIGYGLSEYEADKLWDEWEQFKESCWCAIIFEMEGDEE